MKPWLKKLLAFLTIPFIALVLTACPDNGEIDEADAPAVEETVEGAEEGAEEADDEIEDAVND